MTCTCDIEGNHWCPKHGECRCATWIGDNKYCPLHGGGQGDPSESRLDSAVVAEKVIDFIEDLGLVLLPWQAMALRAIVTHNPGGSRR